MRLADDRPTILGGERGLDFDFDIYVLCTAVVGAVEGNVWAFGVVLGVGGVVWVAKVRGGRAAKAFAAKGCKGLTELVMAD